MKHASLKNAKRSIASVFWSAVLLCGCGADVQTEPQGAAPPSVRYETGGGESARPTTNQRERQAAFLNRIRQSDPQFSVIERAIFNERNELGLIMDRTVQLEAIPPLMKSLLTQMSREFPGQDLTIVAYAPTQPPVRLGVGRLDARTRQMTYTSDQPTTR
jgi:hypothetical protein